VNIFLQAFAWITDPAHYFGSGSIPERIGEQLAYTAGAVLIGAIIAIPTGLLIGHTGRGREIAVVLSGALRALPGLGVLIVLALTLGIGFQAPLITFVILAIPPLLAGAYGGVESVDRNIIDAARAIGMSEWQVLLKVEVPLGLPLLLSGVRSGALQVVATATLAFFASGGALGVYINEGLKTRDYALMLGASIIVTALAIVIEGAFLLLQLAVTPRGVTASRRRATAPTSRTASRLTPWN
jgi:osmoprotectant transport system permease protein